MSSIFSHNGEKELIDARVHALVDEGNRTADPFLSNKEVDTEGETVEGVREGNPLYIYILINSKNTSWRSREGMKRTLCSSSTTAVEGVLQ